MLPFRLSLFLFFFNDPAPTEINTLSLHDALPISVHYGAPVHRTRRPVHHRDLAVLRAGGGRGVRAAAHATATRDRKSTRLNSSHRTISYAVFCLKKKHKQKYIYNKT